MAGHRHTDVYRIRHREGLLRARYSYGHIDQMPRNEPLSYTDKYPVTKNSWVALNGGRMAEIALAPGEKSRKP